MYRQWNKWPHGLFYRENTKVGFERSRLDPASIPPQYRQRMFNDPACSRLPPPYWPL